MMVSCWVVGFLVAAGMHSLQAVETTSLKVKNIAGAPIEVLWLNSVDPSGPSTHRIVAPLRNGTEMVLNSFDTHQFVVRFLKHIHGVEARFTKGPADEMITVAFNERAGNITVRNHVAYGAAQRTLEDAAVHCDQLAGQHFVDCITQGALQEMSRISDSQARLSRYRDAVSFRLRNYTCADASLMSSQPESYYSYTWTSPDGREVPYEIKVLLDTPHAKIWAVDDFATEDECDILERTGRPMLRRATVAAEDGTSIVSENRKAQQALYDSHQTRFEQDPLWDLQQRILAVTNQHADYNLSHEGQEGFTIIQYNPDDQYFPHCDGSCDGLAHVPTGRVATAVLYCKAPDEGGATTFTKANVFVRPRRLSATFFSYLGNDGKMDSGLTEHSGCPVLAGEKLITTFWMRQGVSVEDNWTKFDPSGIRILTD